MTQTDQKPKISARAELQGYLSLAIVFVVMLVALFWPAGTIDWRRGWLFFSLFVALTVFAMGWIRRDNPELIAVRQKFQKGTKSMGRHRRPAHGRALLRHPAGRSA